MLTARQSEVLGFLRTYSDLNGIMPTLDEVAQGCGFASKSNAKIVIDGLVERGFVRRMANKARALELVQPAMPPGYVEGQPIPVRQAARARTMAGMVAVRAQLLDGAWAYFNFTFTDGWTLRMPVADEPRFHVPHELVPDMVRLSAQQELERLGATLPAALAS